MRDLFEGTKKANRRWNLLILAVLVVVGIPVTFVWAIQRAEYFVIALLVFFVALPIVAFFMIRRTEQGWQYGEMPLWLGCIIAVAFMLALTVAIVAIYS